MTTPDAVRPRRIELSTALPAALAVAAAGATPLPWWRAGRGAVLLGSGPVRELPPDVWTGVEVLGWWAAVIVVPAGIAVVAAVLAAAGSVPARPRPIPDGADPAFGPSTAPDIPFRWAGVARSEAVARWAAGIAGLAATWCAASALAGWGTSGAIGAWPALVAGLAAVATALVRRNPAPGELRVSARRVAHSGTASFASRPTAPRVVVVMAAVAAVAVALVVAPSGFGTSDREPVGPFTPVAAVGAFPLRSGEPGLAADDDARPVLADGAPGVVSRAGVVVVGANGRARVLARTDRGAPAPIGVVGDRVVRWISADAVAVTELHPGSTVDVIVRGVSKAGPPGAEGSVWLRTDADPVGTVRRLDVAGTDGEQRLAATYLPVVTIQEPVPPVDVRSVLPVRGGGLRTVAGAGRLEMLTGTAAGISAVPLAGSGCGAAGTAGLAGAVPDGSGVWFVLHGHDGARLAHLDPAAHFAVRAVPVVLPGEVAGLAAPGDGSVLVVVREAQGAVLWQLRDATAALAVTGEPVSCPPVS